jgi:dipeptidase
MLNFRRIPRRQFPAESFVDLRRGGRLAQVERTSAFLWSENPGLEFSDAYLNEWGVAVVSDSCPTREDGYETLVQRGEIRDGGIGYMLRRLVAERAKTAREGVVLAGGLVERFGYVDSGRSYVVADAREAWLLAVVRGRRWVAQRVPDDAIVVLPNIHIIGEVDLDDADNFLGSPDLVAYAVQRGWYDPAGGEPFNFRKAYRRSREDSPDIRRWRGRQLAAGCDEPWPPRDPPPLGVKPKWKLSVGALIDVLRFTGVPAAGSGERPLSTPGTQEGAVFQLRSDMPPAIGCVYWRTTAEPSTSVLTPWYLGITGTPKSYYRAVDVTTQLSLDCHFQPPEGAFDEDPDLAWWKFKRLQDAVRADFERRIAIVQPAWAEFERTLFDDQPEVERQALELWDTDRQAARKLLTDYCARVAAAACRQADELVERFSPQVCH